MSLKGPEKQLRLAMEMRFLIKRLPESSCGFPTNDYGNVKIELAKTMVKS